MKYNPDGYIVHVYGFPDSVYKTEKEAKKRLRKIYKLNQIEEDPDYDNEIIKFKFNILQSNNFVDT